ncbi:hypothetical protein P3X46_028262 [Hevea brasiliensis]|uniref:AAA+ ATPase domain-containing protein n=1 Tax=Hevea brasiliensis TaxID=3981 RepID=A0ABQ9KRF7_HEVBR|nr:hypothetical protein P3X46_028262 [Hevea brasiliensis]
MAVNILIAVASVAVEIIKPLVVDILIPVASVAVEIIKPLVAPIRRHIGYLTGYELNIKNLKEELQKLKNKKTVVDAGHTPYSIIQWQKQVDDIIKKGDEFFQNENKCFNTNCPDPMSRYSLSKKAKEMTETVLDLLKKTEEFGINLGSAFITKGIMDFTSRESIKNKVWEALNDDNLSRISICGAGGVGKTTMVKQLVQRVERENLFDVVGMAVVSENPNIKKIQGDIASWLKLKLDDENELKRAGELRQGLINHGKRILIVLDDVWRELDFEKIGLPSRGERKGHKIMLTSRNIYECNKMGSEKNFPVDVLTKDEAWDLFREMAGISIDQDLRHTATEIADECGGLPLAIVTIAKGLKNRGRNTWDDTLQQLKNSNLQGVSRDVFSRIELSYKLLEAEEAKSCFLLCSLFPEDFDIRVEDLVRYGMGLRLFKNVDKVHHARTRVYNLIDELKESFLLLEGDGHDYVKMHDIVRDVAISIASRDKQWHTLQSEAKMKEWREEDGYKHCIAISLLYEKISDQLNDLEYPKLELLQIGAHRRSPGHPNIVYAGMKELKVLALSSSFPSLLQSLDVLRNLRTLRLVVFNEYWGRAIGALVKLEILEIRGRCLRLPGEIGQLKNLRLLDLRRVDRLEYIPSGVLLALSKLEELYLPYRFGNWEPMEDGRKTNASLSELDTHHMTALEISVPKASILPEVSVFRNLERFKICVGCTNEIVADRNYAKVLQLRDDASDIKETGMKVLMGKAEVLNLIKVINMKEVISTDECVEQGYLVDALQGIPRLPEIQLPYFGKLRELNIDSCHELKYFIPLSMAKGLRQLHKISVEICKEMEGIFNNSEVDDEVEFPELTDLELRDLPNFRGFIINKSLSWKDIDQPSTSQRNNSTEIEHAQLQSMAGPVEMISILFPSLCQRLSNLQKLYLSNCGLLKVAFPPSVARQLVRLEELTVIDCLEIEYIVAETQQEEKDKRISKIVFPNLILLELSRLPKLMAFCADNHISFDWPSLERFTLDDCPKMEKLCSAIPDSSTLKNSFDQSGLSGKEVMHPTSSVIQRLVRRGRKQKDVSNKEDIKQQNTSRMNNKAEIEHAQLQFTTGPVEIISILFPSLWLPSNLQKLSLDECGFVKVVFPLSVPQQLEQLKYLRIWRCPKVEYIVAEVQEVKNKRISQKVFPNLIELNLDGLPKLMALCADSHISFDWLSLKEFSLGDCPKMKILCSTISDSSTLKKSFNQSDLSGKKVMCPSSIIRGLVRRGGKQKNVSNKEVSLIKNQEDPSVSHIDLIERLQNLKNLKISDCDSMEVIFSFEGLIPKECHATTGVLNSMEEMRFHRLSNLKHVCFKIPPEIKAFQKLQKLEVESCDNLINLFSPGLAKPLVKLQQIEITNCKMMEEIIGKEDEEKQEESMQKIVFPQLNSLTFGNLPNFKGFYSGIYALELPKIQKLTIFGEKCTVNESVCFVS